MYGRCTKISERPSRMSVTILIIANFSISWYRVTDEINIKYNNELLSCLIEIKHIELTSLKAFLDTIDYDLDINYKQRMRNLPFDYQV